MNAIVNKFLLARDKFMPEMYLRFTYSACGAFTKDKEKMKKKAKKQEIQNIFIRMNQRKLIFNMIWLMEILKI